MGVPNARLVICRISNGSISANGYPIHFMFRSRVVFSIKPKMAAMTWYDMAEDIGKSQAMSTFAKLLWPLFNAVLKFSGHST